MRNIYIFSILSFLLLGCSPKEEDIYQQAAKDNTFAHQLSIDVLKEVLTIVPDFIVDRGNNRSDDILITATPIITEDTYPKTITINYGTGVTDERGKTRSGEITVTLNSSNILSENLTIAFDNYKVNNTQIVGVYNFTKTGSGYSANTNSENIALINPNGTMLFQSVFILNRTTTRGTANLADDYYTLTFTSNGVDFNQRAFNASSNSTHLIKFDCLELITSGTATIQPTGKGDQSINLGTEGCDNIGLLTTDGNTVTFSF